MLESLRDWVVCTQNLSTEGQGTCSISPPTSGHLLKVVQVFEGITSARLPRWLSGKESACNLGDAGDTGSIPGSGRSPGGGHGNPLQYSCWDNPMDREAWWATVHVDVKSWTGLSRSLTEHNSYHRLLLLFFVKPEGSVRCRAQLRLPRASGDGKDAGSREAH